MKSQHTAQQSMCRNEIPPIPLEVETVRSLVLVPVENC
jgi:hypothetical protein